MRYLLDTNIFIFLATDLDSLDRNIQAILEDYDNVFCLSAESIRELIVGYRKKSFHSKRWKSCEEMVRSIEDEFGIKILALKKEHMLTYSRLEINEAQDHKDPSDHVIISQAITERIPLISSDTKFEFYRAQKLDLVFNKKR